jgi:hypothetical protein
MSLLSTDDLENYIPTLKEAHKKTPLEPRLEIINKLLEINNFNKLEPYIVDNILEIILDRMDDKPKVSEKANDLGNFIINNLSIQAFPRVIQVLFKGLSIDKKWRVKIGTLDILGSYIDRVENMDRDLLSSCLPELVNILNDILYDTKIEVAEKA